MDFDTRLNKYWEKFILRISPKVNNENHPEKLVTYWREKIIHYFYLVGIFLGGIAYLSSLFNGIKTETYTRIAVITIIYLTIVAIPFIKSIKYIFKSIIFISLIFILGAYLYLFLGMISSGSIWITSVPIFSLLLLGKRAAVISLIINLIYYIVGGLLLSNYLVIWYFGFEYYNTFSWILNAIDSLNISAILVFGFAVIMYSFENSLRGEIKAKKLYDDEIQRTALLVKQLKNEIQERVNIEANLKKSEERFRKTQVYGLVGAWEIDLNGKKVWLSEQSYKILGIKKSNTNFDLEYLKLLMNPEDWLVVYDKISSGIMNKALVNFKCRIIKQINNESRWIHFIGEVYETSNGLYVLGGTLHDVTDEIDIQNELFRSQLWFKNIYDNAQDGMLVMRDYKFIQANSKAAELFKMEKSKIENTPPEILSPVYQSNGKTSAEMAKFYIDKSINEGGVQFEWIHKDSYDREFLVEVTLNSFIYENQNYCIAILRDITEKKLLEDNLRLNQNRLSLAIEATNDALWDYDYIKQNGFFSDKNYSMIGYNRDEIGEKLEKWIKLIHPDDSNRIQKVLKSLTPESPNFSYEFRILHKNGSWVWILSRGKILDWTREHKPARIIGVHTDITENKNYEERIKELNRELEEKVNDRTSKLSQALEELKYENEERKRTQEELYKLQDELVYSLAKTKELSSLKSRFIKMVSHEYRTPLTAILSSSYIIESLFENREKDNFQRKVKIIQDSVITMSKMLDNVLEIGNTDLDNYKIKVTKIELCSYIASITDEIRYNYSFKNQINIEKPNNVVFIYSDQTALRNILSNLLSNALKFSNENVIISLDVNNDHVSISLTDKGIGIPENESSNLFEPFFRASNVGSIQGNGLGLAIVKKYLDIINGSIRVYSKPNEFTTFQVTIPRNLKIEI